MSTVAVVNGQDTGKEVYDADVKTRVTKEQKLALQEIASNRHLEMSDIVREAFREYLAKHNPRQLELAAVNGKAAA